MVGNYRVITLCGSTRFKESFLEGQMRFTLEGKIIVYTTIVEVGL